MEDHFMRFFQFKTLEYGVSFSKTLISKTQ